MPVVSLQHTQTQSAELVERTAHHAFHTKRAHFELSHLSVCSDESSVGGPAHFPQLLKVPDFQLWFRVEESVSTAMVRHFDTLAACALSQYFSLPNVSLSGRCYQYWGLDFVLGMLSCQLLPYCRSGIGLGVNIHQ
jgi:hypothetical protein